MLLLLLLVVLEVLLRRCLRRYPSWGGRCGGRCSSSGCFRACLKYHDIVVVLATGDVVQERVQVLLLVRREELAGAARLQSRLHIGRIEHA